MPRIPPVAGLFIVLLSGWLPAPAGAQQNDYKALTEAAVEEHSLGHYEEARALFAKAHAINPNARTFWGMGTAAFEARQYVDAMQLFDAALRDTRKPLTDAQRKQAESLRKRSEDYVVRVEVSLEPKSARLSVDGREAERTSSGALLLDAGLHQLVASAEGYEEWVRAIRWEAGTASLEIKLQRRSPAGSERAAAAASTPAQSAGPGPSSEPTRATSALGVLKWVALGTTIAAGGIAGAGIALREQTAQKWNDEQRCPKPMKETCASLPAAETKWKTMGIVGGATAGVFAVLTVVFFVMDRGKPDGAQQARTLCAPDGPGALCTVRF